MDGRGHSVVRYTLYCSMDNMARVQVEEKDGPQIVVVEKGSEGKRVAHDNRSRKRNS